MRGSRPLLVATIFAAEIVRSVSGFAQTNNSVRAVAAIERRADGAYRRYVPGTRHAAAAAELPSNLEASSVYRSVLESMLRRSPTFRRQCERIGGTAHLVVTLRAQGASAPGFARARTRFFRTDRGLLASIEVMTVGDPEELIAHEIEHVIEQLDEIDLASRSVMSASGVSLVNDESYETTRAKRVGLAVAAEVRRGGG